MGPIQKSGQKILGIITPRKAEGLLVTWANLRTPERMRLHHSDVVGSLADQDLLELRDDLRLVWDTPDRRHRDWYLFQLRQTFHHDVIMGDVLDKREAPNPGRLSGRLAAPPALTPFEAALEYFRTRIGDRAKHCGGPDCPAPYFIAVKRWQKYCSLACAGPAGREAKRKWWHERKGKGLL